MSRHALPYVVSLSDTYTFRIDADNTRPINDYPSLTHYKLQKLITSQLLPGTTQEKICKLPGATISFAPKPILYNVISCYSWGDLTCCGLTHLGGFGFTMRYMDKSTPQLFFDTLFEFHQKEELRLGKGCTDLRSFILATFPTQNNTTIEHLKTAGGFEALTSFFNHTGSPSVTLLGRPLNKPREK